MCYGRPFKGLSYSLMISPRLGNSRVLPLARILPFKALFFLSS